jgi:hypothetical protein
MPAVRTGGWRARVGGLWWPVGHAGSAQSNGHRPALLAVLTVAFSIRFGASLALPNINQADEIYQVAEQAHRSVRGYGIEPWEFRTRSRTVLLPTLVMPIYRLDVSARAHRVIQNALFSALSLIPVWVAFRWGGRLDPAAGCRSRKPRFTNLRASRAHDC